MWSILVKGGFVMIPLSLCSILALYIIVERLIYYLRTTEDCWAILRRIKPFIRSGQWNEARLAIAESSNPYSRILAKSLVSHESILAGDDTPVEMAAQEELNYFQRGLVLLDTIVTAAPMLGLLGTVTGIISSFNILALTSGQATTQSISQGIAEALIATATGLVIAIPTLFFLNFFQKRVEIESKKLAQFGEAVLDVIRGGEHGGVAN